MMTRAAAVASIVLLSSIAAVAPSSAATPSPRRIKLTFKETNALPEVMIVRLWSPDGKTSTSLRCVNPVYTFSDNGTTNSDRWAKNKCAGSPAAHKVRATLLQPDGRLNDPTYERLVIRIWSPNGRTSTAWRCGPPLTTGNTSSSSAISAWYKGQCAAA